MWPIRVITVLATLYASYGFVFSQVRLVKRSTVTVFGMPLELTGQLDPSKKWPVSFKFNGLEKTVDVSEGTSLLEASEKIFDGVESSCRNGVCTTCAAQIIDGKSSIKMAVHGLGEPQINAGYVCACQTYCVGPGVVVELGKYDEVYETQYGQFEKSYQKK